MPAKFSLLWKVTVIKSPNTSSMREGLPHSWLLLQTIPSCHESLGSWCAHRAGDEAHTYPGVKCLLGVIPEQIICCLTHVAPTWCSSAWNSGSTAGKQEGKVREARTETQITYILRQTTKQKKSGKRDNKRLLNVYPGFISFFFLILFFFISLARQTLGCDGTKGLLNIFKNDRLKKVKKCSLGDFNLKIKATEMQPDQSCPVVSQPLLLLILTGFGYGPW